MCIDLKSDACFAVMSSRDLRSDDEDDGDVGLLVTPHAVSTCAPCADDAPPHESTRSTAVRLRVGTAASGGGAAGCRSSQLICLDADGNEVAASPTGGTTGLSVVRFTV